MKPARYNRVAESEAGQSIKRAEDTMNMLRHYFISNNLDDLEVFEEQLEAKVEQVKQLKDDLEKKATDTVEGLLQKVLGPYLSKIETLKNVYNLVSDITRLVNMVRWGARVIACLSPPAWGCLWILAQALLEKLAEKGVFKVRIETNAEHCAGRNYFLRKLKAARTEHFGNKGTANNGVE